MTFNSQQKLQEMLAFRHIYQCKDKHTVLIQILKGSLNRILCKMSYLAQLGFIDMCLPNTAFTKRQNIHNININNNNNHNHE